MSGRTPAAHRKKIVLAAVAVGLVLLLALFEYLFPLHTLLPANRISARAEGELRIHFLDVGQGDCTLIEFPEGDGLIIDAGDGAFGTENGLIGYVKGLRLTEISYLVTHSDIDHYGGFAELIDVFGAAEIFLPATSADTAAYRRLLSAVERSGAEIKYPSRGDTVAVRPSGAYAVCVSPETGEDFSDTNDSSAVVFLGYGGVNVLLCGDISSAREQSIMEGGEELRYGEYAVRLDETDILKVAHHGSASSSSQAWLNYLGMQVAVLSCGRGNAYSHPAAESVERLTSCGAQVYRTDELGNIVVSIKDGTYSVFYQ